MTSLNRSIHHIRVFLRKSKNAIFQTVYKLATHLPIKQKQFVFFSETRSSLSGNMSYVYEELKKRNILLTYKFFFKETIAEPKTTWYLIRLAYTLGRSRYIIIDDFLPRIYPLKIREGADLVQLWHAAGAFKKFGYSRIGLPGGPPKNSKHHRNYTKVFVSSQNVIDYYAEGFGVPKERILALGLPRTDVFFDVSKQNFIKKSLIKELPYLKGKKVILFAPTFRGNGQKTANYPKEWINFEKLYQSLKGTNTIFLFKYHPFIKNRYKIPNKFKDLFFDVSDFREINNLLLVTDILITDYSSVIFEYALLKKKCIQFAPDLKEYTQNRGFYFEYQKMIIGTVAKNSDELIEQIIRKNNNIDEEKYNKFIDYFCKSLDGNSTKRIVDYLLENMAKNNEY
ncbi:CDP-glycerol glycerophosphotransferase family protein [Enterococcus thailandicus]|uniref:CDP-glycerol glycerophosphotransferase family protein n=1 Tax=Enterococcus thailandicus TaxID=417368 RepID=UPI0022E1BD73|nr:CDP-glycerol glycerophosphotransferase family protein [Enterococcus thailandicus]